MATASYCTFQVDRFLCGIPVRDVQEIQRWQAVTRVPLAPPAVLGLLNLRGQIVTAVDLRRRMGLADAAERPSPILLVVRLPGEGGKAALGSLVADRIRDVMQVDDIHFEPPPRTLPDAQRDVLHGVFKLKDGQLLLALDTVRCTTIPQLAQVA